MPIFEYCCDKCGAAFEELVFGKNQAAPPCPKCGSKETGKLVSRPARHCAADGGFGENSGGGGGCSGCAGGHCASCGH
ncbi:MAG: zinc ribbon domain-containing protein [Deltaproteobacteria bacterium]|jgi:putative FmdB family regulatory protein|nr:zinc ribbon domain-containing protein [Deltaproteobacteria bacterium]